MFSEFGGLVSLLAFFCKELVNILGFVGHIWRLLQLVSSTMAEQTAALENM